jgi:hypothetical protein
MAAICLSFVMLSAGSALAQSPLYNYALQLGSSGDDMGRGVAIDADGNVYITGTFRQTVDFDPGNGIASLTAVDSLGDAFVAKYDPAGNYLWAFRIGGTGAFADAGTSIAIDRNGYVVVKGAFWGTADFDPGPNTAIMTETAGNQFIARYTPTGNYLWVHQLPVSMNALALDSNGNIVLTGSFSGSVDFDPGSGKATLQASHSEFGSTFVARYSSNGTYLWAFAIPSGSTASTAGYHAVATSLAIDGSNNISLGGKLYGTVSFNPKGKESLTASGSGSDIFIARYSPAGAYLSAFRAGGSGEDGVEAIAIDGSGNLYVTGRFSGTVDFNPGTGTSNLTAASSSDLFIAGYTSSGGYRWAFTLGGTGLSDQGHLAVDRSGNLYLGDNMTGTMDFDPGNGTANLTSSGGTSFIASYGPSGVYRWVLGLDGMVNARDLAVDAGGDIASTGILFGATDFDPGSGTVTLTPAGGRDIFVATYTPYVAPKRCAGTGSYEASEPRIAPNPFTDNFRFTPAGTSQPCRIQIVDMMGRVVETRELSGTDRDVTLGSDLPAGSYFVWIGSGQGYRAVMIRKTE